MFIPIVALLLASVFLANNAITKGSFMERSTELKGGKLITFQVREIPDISGINYDYHITRGITNNVIIEIPYETNETLVIEELNSYLDPVGEPTITTVGPLLGDIFWQQAQLSILIAFIAMAVVVFILFRSLVPSTIVLLAAATDIVITMAVIDVLGVKLSLAVLAALLMIIGYSVDTDILLTSNVLKTEEDIEKSARRAMKTGLVMSGAALIAFIMLYLLSGSFVLQQMSVVLIVGLIIDLPATWFTNAGLLRYWLERKRK
jgi:preprotein translocase subunit SecF